MKNYTQYIDTFLFRRSWGDIFESLPDEKAGMLVKAVYSFTEGEDTIPDDPELSTMYRVLTRQLNYSARKYAVKFGLVLDET